MKGSIQMKVEVRKINVDNEVKMKNLETGDLFIKKVNKQEADIYRKKLEENGIFEMVLYSDHVTNSEKWQGLSFFKLNRNLKESWDYNASRN